MFPPLLCLVLLFGLVPCLYLREQDTGKGLYLVIGKIR